MVQFIDLNAGVTGFQRHKANDIKTCDETIRRVDLIHKYLNEFEILTENDKKYDDDVLLKDINIETNEATL